MRNLTPLILLCTLSFYISAQQPGVQNSMPVEVGDTLFYFTDDLPQRIKITPEGPDQDWNYTNLKAPYLEYMLVGPAESGRNSQKYPEADLVYIDQEGREEYIDLREEGIWKLGGNYVSRYLGSVNTQYEFEDGIQWQQNSVKYLDAWQMKSELSEQTLIDDLPRSKRMEFRGLDSLRWHGTLTRQFFADAWGSLRLPGGQYRVLRIRVDDDIQINDLMTKRRGSAWTSSDQKSWNNSKRSYYHFVDLETGEIKAIVYLDATNQPDQVVYTMPKGLARYYPPATPGQWLYAYPNPAFSIVRFKFTDLRPGIYTIRFYNILGKVLMEMPQRLEDNATVEVSVGHLAKGTYLYSVIGPEGKKLITKRLVILKP